MMPRMYKIITLFAILLSLSLLAFAGEVRQSIQKADFDTQNSGFFVNGNLIERPNIDQLTGIFGLEDNGQNWVTEQVKGSKRHFVISFNKPVTIGTLITPQYLGTEKIPLKELDGKFVSILKSDAAFPCDPNDNNQWVLLPAGMVKYLPIPINTRAIRFSDISAESLGRNYLGLFDEGRKSTFGEAFCLAERYYNGADVGRILGTQTGTATIGFRNDENIAGIVVFAQNTTSITVSALRPNIKSAPEAVVKDDASWTPARIGVMGKTASYSPDDPLVTKGLRVVGSRMTHIIPLIALENGKNSPALMPKLPFAINYEMPQDGFVAINIYDKENKLVKRLISETARDKGKASEGWDLTDENDGIIPPGEYTWKGITRPEFNITYMMTAYNAGVPAWNAPAPAQGGGGWLADHAPGISVATFDNKMWIISPCAESGDSMIATDLEGNKLWGSGFIFGFDGPHAITADERFGYALTTQGIFRIDSTDSYKNRMIFKSPNPSLPGFPWAVTEGIIDSGPNGIAVNGDKMYVAINAPEPSWLRSAFSSNDMDPDMSQPYVFLKKGGGSRKQREDKNYAWGEYDELMKYYSTFFTEKTPSDTPTMANYPIPHEKQSVFGDAPKAGQLSGSLINAFKTPQTIGTIIVPDASIRVFKLKEQYTMADFFEVDMPSVGMLGDIFGDGGGMLGPNLEEAWDELKVIGRAGNVGIVLAPEGGYKTAALRYQTDRLKYSLVTARRFTNVEADAKLVGTHGAKTNNTNGITITTDYPFNQHINGAIAIVWQEEQKELRGLMLFDPPVSTKQWTPVKFAVDQFVGPAGIDPEATLENDSMWRHVTNFENDKADILNVDFGELVTTKALRIRLLDSCSYRAFDRAEPGYYSGFSRIIALKYMGSDPKGLATEMPQRIVEFTMPSADDNESQMVITNNIPLTNPIAVQFGPDNKLYAISDGNIVTVPLDGTGSKIIVNSDEFVSAYGLAIDNAGNFYVTDNGAGQQIIKVYDKSGKFVKTIGKPGGPKPGAWDPHYLVNPAGIAVDKNNKIWVADYTYTPKRFQIFNQNGVAEKSFLGPTQYGGGGYMDTKDRNHLYYQGMKFTLDWDKYNWELTSLLGIPVEITLYYEGFRYLTTGLYAGSIQPGVNLVFEKDNKAIPVLFFGKLEDWFAMNSDNPEIVKKFATEDSVTTIILWSDNNADGKAQIEEVQYTSFASMKDKNGVSLPHNGRFNIGEDMTLYYAGARTKPKSFDKNTGIVQYDLNNFEVYNTFVQDYNYGSAPSTGIIGDADGRIFTVGTRLIKENGQETVWDWYNRYAVHGGFYNAPWGQNRPAGVRQQEHSPIAHFKSYGEEYYVTNSDCGEFYVYTADGMFLGCIVGGPIGYGQLQWNVPEWENGKTNLNDLRVGQEHYQGHVAAPDDKQVYAIAGHNHMSVLKIDGFESIIRMEGKINITDKDLTKTAEWKDQMSAIQHSQTEVKIARMPLVSSQANISGGFDEWPDIFSTINRKIEYGLNLNTETITAEGAVAYDAENLYLAIRSVGNLKNSSADPLMLFKSGEAAEFTLGLNPDADPNRTQPVLGDIRILISVIDGKPTAVLYKPVDPTAPTETQKEFSSPVGRVWMDRVEVIKDAKIGIGRETVYQKESARTIQYSVMRPADMWHIEIAIPWKSLGFSAPKPFSILRGDFGILNGDANGMRTIGRQYWSGKTQTVISDIPSESRLNPSLWGEIHTLVGDKDTDIGNEMPDSMLFPF